MRIVNIRALRGPNYWAANIPKLIVMKVDLEDYEQLPSNKIEGFYERLKTLLPTMHGHRCSPGVEGGFFQRVKTGTWMGHIIEHIALELQTLAGMYCGFGKTRKTRNYEGEYNVVFAYQIEECGKYAAKSAFEVALSLAENKAVDIDKIIEELKVIRQKESLGPSTASIVKAAKEQGIPWFRLDKNSSIQFGYGSNQKRIQATITEKTGYLAVNTASNKDKTKNLLEQAGLPIPTGYIIREEQEIATIINKTGYPLAIKPLNGNHGRGVSVDIQNEESAKDAFRQAKQHSASVIVESYIKGNDYRFLVINHKLVAVAQRIPARVLGDGYSTIRQLVEAVNEDPRRGNDHENVLSKIKIDDLTIQLLHKHSMTPESVPAKGEEVQLKFSANLSTGGTSKDVTDLVHPENKQLAEQVSRIIKLDICGIDIISQDISVPLYDNSGAVIEVNAAPGFRMHLEPSEGKGRNVGKHVIDMLFPKKSQGRIPIVAVTGTNGKTTTSRLIAHMAKTAGNFTGLTTTDGIYLNDRLVKICDCAGPGSGISVLQNPNVDFAVLECARGGIIRSGLPFDKCDVGVVTNVSEDHMGLNDIHTIEQLSRVKSIVPLSVKENGVSVINADNEHTLKMREKAKSRIALFSLNPDNKHILEHVEKGGLAAVAEDGQIVILDGDKKHSITEIKAIPLSFAGKAKFNIENILAASLAGYSAGFSKDIIRKALSSFAPNTKTTPGRMNSFRFPEFDFLVDYVHNTDGAKRVMEFLSEQQYHHKTGIISAAGDRRDSDIVEIGKIAGKFFNEIIIRIDKHTRGRNSDDIVALLMKGARMSAPNMPIQIIKKEKEAIRYSIDNAKKDSLIFLFCEDIVETIDTVKAMQEEAFTSTSTVESRYDSQER